MDNNWKSINRHSKKLYKQMRKHGKKVSHMGLLELIIVLILIFWVLGGLVLLPIGGGVLNLLVAVVIIWIIWQVLNNRA